MMKSGLEVFDFKEEDEIPDYVARKFVDKFRNPKDVSDNHISSSSVTKCGFLSNVCQKSSIPTKMVQNRTVDIVSSELDCAKLVSKGLMESSMRGDDNEDLKSEFRRCSPGAIQSPNMKVDDETDNSFSENSSAETQPFSSSICYREIISLKFSFEQGSDESDPLPHTAEAVKNLDGSTAVMSSHDCSIMKTDSIHVAVDYLLYKGRYCTGCSVVFTSIGIKIEVSDIYNPLGYSCFRSIDDIVGIEFKSIHQFNHVMIKVLPETEVSSDKNNANLGFEELEFTVVDPEWPGKWEVVSRMNVKYATLWATARENDGFFNVINVHQPKHYFPKFDSNFEDFIYPKGDADAVSISKQDVELLQPETFVNDTMIDFYIKYLKNQIPPEEAHRFHFFNSFFFRKLADLDKDPSSVSDGKAAFFRVRKWTRKVDLFGKDYIFIPVNFNLHWSLLVFCHLGETISINDKELDASSRTPCVLHMDSIKGSHGCLKDLVQSYLREEWNERHKDSPTNLSSKFLNLRFVPLELPQQENLYDCGLFLLHYLELFLAEAPFNFNLFAIGEDSNFLTSNWFPPVEASLKRTRIQKIISQLLESRSNEDALDNENANDRMQVASLNLTSCSSEFSEPQTQNAIQLSLSVKSTGNYSPLLDHCSSFGRQTFFTTDQNSQIQKDTTSDNQVYFPLMTGEEHRGNAMSYSIGCFTSDSWKLRSVNEASEGSESSSSSSSFSGDSDVGVKNCYRHLPEGEVPGNDICDEGLASSSDVGEWGELAEEMGFANDGVEAAGALENGHSSPEEMARCQETGKRCCEVEEDQSEKKRRHTLPAEDVHL